MKKSYIAPVSERLNLSIESGILLSSVVVSEDTQPGGEAWTPSMNIWNNNTQNW